MPDRCPFCSQPFDRHLPTCRWLATAPDWMEHLRRKIADELPELPPAELREAAVLQQRVMGFAETYDLWRTIVEAKTLDDLLDGA